MDKFMVVKVPRQCSLVFVVKFNSRKDEKIGSKNSKDVRSGERKI
jgi:hypothetical protein